MRELELDGYIERRRGWKKRQRKGNVVTIIDLSLDKFERSREQVETKRV